MTLLDRYILKQFFFNFLILFLILFLFSCIIDLFVNLNSFLDSVDRSAAEAGETLTRLEHFGRLGQFIVGFYTPRLFQFYAFLVGLVTVGAMGFTLVQLHRHRELTAVLAAGVSLHRVALPILLAAMGLNLLQFVNRELILPHYAAQLMRSQSQFGTGGMAGFRVPLLRDSFGRMFYARKYRPEEQVLENLVILELDRELRLLSRIQASRATWTSYRGADGKLTLPNESVSGGMARGADGVAGGEGGEGVEGGGQPVGEWVLADGEKTVISSRDRDNGGAMGGGRPFPWVRVVTDLDPTRVLLYRHREFRQLLNLRQISELQASYSMDRDELAELARIRYGRFAQILVNIITLLMALPFFLLRSPADLLRQSVWCAALGILAQVGGAIGTAVGFAGIPPAASVFLVPLLILLPLAMALMSRVET